MQALVHFTVGMSMAMILLLLVDFQPSEEFFLVFLSGYWALIPDGHMILRELGLQNLARPWYSFHRSPVADLFWFHRFIDHHETGEKNVELGVTLLLFLVVIISFYRYNHWT